ncbi:hypothetical protein EDD15DRAFT_2180950 [Pisolithus albus]|nr:hypothetical protein EDD15DRAFT_2180950 [Pisolithus albus]
MGYPLVYLPAIKGHVAQDIVWTLPAFLEFCYIVQQNVITDNTLSNLKNALDHFHYHRKIFWESSDYKRYISLPRQHSLVHYEALIHLFGVLNGLCTSITESKHITVVKKPWWLSSKYRALGQILQTNQSLAQLAATCSDFEAGGMLPISWPRENMLQGNVMFPFADQPIS